MRHLQESFTSVTRWLLVVVGCAALEAAQPMSAAEETPGNQPPRSADTVIYPQGSPERPLDARPPATSSRPWLVVGTLLLGGAGAWLLVKRRGGMPFGTASRAHRKIIVEETRSLGNRQYLVVAGYKDRRFLLGVTPGRIQMLTHLDDDEAGGQEP